MLVLREACCTQRDEARIWTLYAVQCLRVGRVAESVQALRQAMWLRERARDKRRARSTRILLGLVESGQTELPLRAA
jgi:hypothetical protein